MKKQISLLILFLIASSINAQKDSSKFIEPFELESGLHSINIYFVDDIIFTYKYFIFNSGVLAVSADISALMKKQKNLEKQYSYTNELDSKGLISILDQNFRYQINIQYLHYFTSLKLLNIFLGLGPAASYSFRVYERVDENLLDYRRNINNLKTHIWSLGIESSIGFELNLYKNVFISGLYRVNYLWDIGGWSSGINGSKRRENDVREWEFNIKSFNAGIGIYF